MGIAQRLCIRILPTITLAVVMAVALATAPGFARVPSDAKVFDEAAEIVRDNFYDPKMKGRDWDAIVARHRPLYLASESVKARSDAINAMLAELDASHTMHMAEIDPRYYQLVDIFRFGLRDSIKQHLPYGVSYSGIGIFTREIEGKAFVTGVIAGLPAAKAGLVVGDEIVSVDDKPFEPVESFRGKAGSVVKLSLRRERDGLSPLSMSVPNASSPARHSSRRCTRGRASSNPTASGSATSVSGPMPESAIRTP